MLNLRLSQPSHLIDLNDLCEWERISCRDGYLEIGFLTRHAQIAASSVVQKHCPLLAHMAHTIGHDAIRHRGTIGGSLSHADPAAQLALMAVTLDARLHVVSADSKRTLPARDFFIAAMTTALQANELLIQVDVPVFQPGEAGGYAMFNRRHGDYALVAVALTLRLDAGKVAHMRLGISGVADKPLRLPELERQFVGTCPDDAWQTQLAQAVRASVQPEDDAQIPARYRQDLAQEMTLRALRHALSEQRMTEHG